MRKIIYALSVVCILVFSLASCTKEEVKPADGNSVGGGVSGKI